MTQKRKPKFGLQFGALACGTIKSWSWHPGTHDYKSLPHLFLLLPPSPLLGRTCGSCYAKLRETQSTPTCPACQRPFEHFRTKEWPGQICLTK